MDDRASGILLHPTSLPSPHGVGDLGGAAYRFVDFLADAGQRYWQVCPLNPTSPHCGNSPYSSLSAFAGNTLLISPERLVEEELVPPSALDASPRRRGGGCDYPAAIGYKEKLLDEAYRTFRSAGRDGSRFQDFCRAHAAWVEDYALFVVVKRLQSGRPWNRWPGPLKDRQPAALDAVRAEFAEDLEREKFFQYLFTRQWSALREHCAARGVRVIGDLSIYVSLDSADVWAHPELFLLAEDKSPEYVSGVPPDFFSPTGQLWGNPIYRWDRLEATGFRWWLDRIEHNRRYVDALRIDHARGLVSYWQVPAAAETAMQGEWVRAPAEAFFAALRARFPDFPLIAEDLGLITPDVRTVLDRLGLPGMRVLLFAFFDDSARNPYLPHMYPRNCVVYTGTHDNNTARGWFEQELSPEQKRRLHRYLGREVPAEEIPSAMVRLAALSVADLAVFPLQDVLALGAEARMNVPGVAQGNWEWQLAAEQLTPVVAATLRELTALSARR
jgi:4-alpha-glucanotransferase